LAWGTWQLRVALRRLLKIPPVEVRSVAFKPIEKRTQSRCKEEEALNKGLFTSFLVLQGIKPPRKN
jgi:hypothetical protein